MYRYFSDQRNLEGLSMKFIDYARTKYQFVEGYFKAYVIEDEETKLHYEKKNVIVLGASKAMAHSIGDCETSYCIDQFRLGGDNSLDAQTLISPPAPTINDEDLMWTANLFVRNRNDEIDGSPAFWVTYPDAPNERSVMFHIRIGKSEANLNDPIATVYTCAGLFMMDVPTLFAHQTFPVMTKTPFREFLFEWEIRF